MRASTRTLYRHLRFVRELDLHVGCYNLPIFAKQDLALAVEDFRAFFALVQDTIADINYNFYARSSKDCENSVERELISKVIEAILGSSRIERIHGHAHVASLRHRRKAWDEAIWGLGIALPHFTSPTHLHSIAFDSSDVKYPKVSYFLKNVSEDIRPICCSFRAWDYPENDLKKLPPSLKHLSLGFSRWSDVGDESWMLVMTAITKCYPTLVSLEMSVRHTWYSSETLEAITADFRTPVKFANLHSLKLICGSEHMMQTRLGRAFHSLQASNLAHITLQGSPSWFSLYSVDVSLLLERTKLETVTFTEELGLLAMDDQDYPWSDIDDVVPISRPLFDDLVQRLETAGVKVKISATSDQARALYFDLTPDDDGFRNSLGTVEGYVQHIKVQFFQPSNDDPPEIDDSYELTHLQSLDVYCTMIKAFSQISKRWTAPGLRSIHLHVLPADAREAALILSELTDMVNNEAFPSLCRLTGSFKGLTTSSKSDSLAGLFMDAFAEACEARKVDIEELVWT